jgi:acetoacetate decarboxylase
MEKKMKLDHSKLYQMPHIMGPIYDIEALPKIPYPEIENFAIQFQTDPDAARALVPDCYEIDKKPIVTVVFGYYKGLDFLAGGGYNIATAQISARFDGEKHHVKGDYILIMFENKTMPILGGRDFLGVPKLYADIPAAELMPNGNMECKASLWGHHLFSIEIPQLKKQSSIVRTVASKRINSRPWLAYKYVPSLDGHPDADYPTITRNDIKIDNLWMGNSASLHFGHATTDDLRYTANVISALKTLPILKVEQVLRFNGSAVLRFDQSHGLK